MSDENERSVASAGSVEPVAWAVMDGTKNLVGYHSCSRDKAEAWAREYGFPEVVPLYRSPALTEDEQEAIGCALERAIQVWTDEERMDIPTVRFWIDTIRKLLARCAG